MTRPVYGFLALALLVLCSASRVRAADYPLALTFNASAATATTSINSVVTVHVDRLMEESRRTRVTETLRTSGYGNFLNALRALPPVGTIALTSRSVEIRYAHEQPDGAGRRLLLVADRPLFFLAADPTKSRAGYELTVVDLRFDAKGGVSGTMTGAARVKPSPDGVVLDDFADAQVRLASRPPKS